MDAQQLLSDFLSSAHGTDALQALGQQGVSAGDAQAFLGHATDAAYEQAQAQSSGMMGDHAGKSFFSAFASGLVRGDGFFKSLLDGGEGVVVGRVAEALAERAGLDPSTAASIAAAATPYVAAFLKQKLA